MYIYFFPQGNSRKKPLSALRGAGTSNQDTVTPKRVPLSRNKIQNNLAPSCSNSKESVNNALKHKHETVKGVKKISPPAASKIISKSTITDDINTPKKQKTSFSICKRTPPLCRCGHRAVYKVANSPGPNQGRCFFTCPNQRRSLGMVTRTCSFFMWC